MKFFKCFLTGVIVLTQIFQNIPSSWAVVTTKTTVYVGNLYEESNGQKIRHIHLGNKKVATIANDKLRYYHDDHLGSVNVVTTAEGVKQEMFEYGPYGEIAVNQKFFENDDDETHYRYTGKEADDESGLYFYGGRYYDPKLGRFTTPDTIVQAPDNPQTLNRYTYANNNPVNNVDPSGHSWKKFWKKWGNFIVGPLGTAVITGDWKTFANIMTATATSFVISGFNPVVAGATFMTESIMATEPGEQLTEAVAQNVFDDALGMKPKAAYMWSSIAIRAGVSLGFEKMLASASGARPVQIQGGKITKEQMDTLQANGNFAGDENMFGPSLKTDGAFKGDQSIVKGLMQDNKLVGSFQRVPLDVPGLKQLGAQHVSTNMLNVASNVKINPLSYGVWGVCDQAANLTLLNAGASSTILNLGASWDMYVTTAVYGNYGGQLGYRVLSGVNANREYQKN